MNKCKNDKIIKETKKQNMTHKCISQLAFSSLLGLAQAGSFCLFLIFSTGV
jgi:hypothetical protein